MTTCDWCLRQGIVGGIGQELWRFWGVISEENPSMESLKNICKTCKSRLESFSTYIGNCKNNESVREMILPPLEFKREPSIDIEETHFKEEPSIDIEYHQLFKDEPPTSHHPTALNTNLPEVPGAPPDTAKRRRGVVAVFECPYCPRRFSHSGHWRNHVRAHTGEKPFECPCCDRTCNNRSDLAIHMRFHTGERRFGCASCGKRFATSSGLNCHRRVHTGERPFGCPLCDKTFAVSANLKRHLSGHAGDKPFKCSHCDRNFTQACHMRSHMRNNVCKKENR